MNIPMRFGRASVGPKGPAPQIGEHSAEVLSDFGIDEGRIADLQKPESWEMPTTDHMNIREILDAYKSESIDLELAESKIRKSFYSDLGHTLLDLDREARTGSGEVIFGSGKTASQIDDIIADASKRS